MVDEIVKKMEKIVIVYLQNNIFNKKIAHYRKYTIAKIPGLRCLDDLPISEDERRWS